MAEKIQKVVFMGTPDFASGILEALLESTYEVQAVFTQPDKPKGRKAVLTPCPVKETAQKAGLTVHQPRRIREKAYIDILKEYAPDVIVVAAFGQILPKEILELPTYGCINVHASLLPAWRGAAPIQWSILSGDSVTGVTTMQMSQGLDTGDMLEKTEVPIDSHETGGSLFDKLQEAGACLLIKTLEDLEKGEITPNPQPAESTTPYASILTKQTGYIDWSRSAEEIERMIRALDPWPSAWTHINGKQLKLWKAHVTEDTGEAYRSGEVIGTTKNALLIGTGKGVLAVTELQIEGKKKMDTGAFLRGYEVPTGAKLGKE